MKKAVLYIIFAGIVLGVQSCIKEDLEGCFNVLRLQVSYAFTTEDADAPIPELRSAKAYVSMK